MRRVILAFWAPAIALVAVAACSTTQPATVDPGPTKVPPSPIFLWKASGAGQPGTAYLLGSVHVRRDDVPLDEAIWSALQASDIVLAELSEAEKSNSALAAQLVFRLGILPTGQTLSSQLDPALNSLLETRAKELNVPVLMFNNMRPWLAALTLISTKLMRDKYDPNSGIDAIVMQRAKEKGAPAAGLETLEQQLSMFATMSPKLQIDLLKDALRGLDPALEGETEQIFAAYQTGDATTLAKQMFGVRYEQPEFESLYRTVFDDRNLAMTSSITGYLKKPQTVFIVAGVGHMLGDVGIPQLLADRGFVVEPVAPQGRPNQPAAPASAPAKPAASQPSP